MNKVDALKSKTNLIIFSQLSNVMQNVIATITEIGPQEGKSASFYLTGVHDAFRIVGGLIIMAYHASHKKGGYNREELSPGEKEIIDACDASSEVLTQILSLTKKKDAGETTPSEKSEDEFETYTIPDDVEDTTTRSIWNHQGTEQEAPIENGVEVTDDK